MSNKTLGLLAAYASSEDEEEKASSVAEPVSPVAKRQKIVAAPDVDVADPASMQLMLSGSYADLAMVPVVGPANPFSTKDLKNNWLTGHIQEDVFNENDFRLQQRTFRTFGYAADPSANAVDENGVRRIVGNLEKAKATGGATVLDARGKHDLSAMPKRLPKGDVAIVEGEGAYLGPWAGYEGERIGEKSGPEGGVVPTDAAAAAKDKEIHVGSEKTVFHGKSERDYLGRTYMHVPQDVDTNLLGEAGSQECFLPKRTIHTYTGHTKGVSAVRFIPNSAHLLLSAGMDTKIKIWDVYHDRKCLRTYLGHNKAVRDITFSNDGRKFLSASYDRYIKLWDTETGQCINSFTTKKIPYCVKFNPDADKQNIFLAGCSDKKIVQFDINTGEITQEYDQHLGAVNSITFVDENRRFVTTSDDKTLRAWEFDIPVVIKYVAEPYMHSMPSVTLHPNKKWLACQSLDNQILIYGAKDRFRQHRKKRFAGHLVDSYACQIGFSPDGRYLSSGDAEGRLWFWDWKTCKILKKIKIHDQVLIGHEWHPHETSKVATCSWDGNIHLLD